MQTPIKIIMKNKKYTSKNLEIPTNFKVKKSWAIKARLTKLRLVKTNQVNKNNF